MLDKEKHMKVCNLFNEVLNDLEKEYRGANFEWGTSDLVKGRGIRESERQHIHKYRVKLNELLKEI